MITLTEEQPMSWDGKTDRRKNSGSLSAHDEVIILQNQYNSLNERITSHKLAQDEGFKKLQESITKIENVLIPKDGSASIFEEIRYLKNTEKTRKEAADNIMRIAIGSVTALLITLVAWLGKFVVFIIKSIGV